MMDRAERNQNYSKYSYYSLLKLTKEKLKLKKQLLGEKLTT